MYALLVKPAALRSKRFAPLIREWVNQGAVLLQSNTRDDIHNEVASLASQANDAITVVACGGDGTVHLLLNSVIGLDVHFAVVPMGTGNDFARYLGLSKAPEAIDVAQSGVARNMDVGHIELNDGSKYFLGIASCGFDAQVNERANTYRGPQGTAKYVAALLGELRSLRALHIQVAINDAVDNHEVTLMALGNTSSYGGGMLVCPNADAYDAQLDVMRVARVNRRTLLRVFPRVFRGTHVSHPAVTMGRASRLEIGGDSFPIYADGERIGIGPAVVSVIPAALTVLHPKETQ